VTGSGQLVLCRGDNQLGATDDFTCCWYPVTRVADESTGPATDAPDADDVDDDAVGLFRTFIDDVIAAAKPAHVSRQVYRPSPV